MDHRPTVKLAAGHREAAGLDAHPPIHVRDGEIVEANEVKGGQVELNNDLAEVVTDDVDGRSRKRAGLAKLKAGRRG